MCTSLDVMTVTFALTPLLGKTLAFPLYLGSRHIDFRKRPKTILLTLSSKINNFIHRLNDFGKFLLMCLCKFLLPMKYDILDNFSDKGTK